MNTYTINVTDKETGKPIKQAHVFVSNNRGERTGAGAITNSQGQAVLSANSTENITITHVGYRSGLVSLQGKGSVINARLDVNEFDEVVITPGPAPSDAEKKKSLNLSWIMALLALLALAHSKQGTKK
jgi:hypothetical protein